MLAFAGLCLGLALACGSVRAQGGMASATTAAPAPEAALVDEARAAELRFGADAKEVLPPLHALAKHYLEAGRPAEAAGVWERVVRIETAVHGAEGLEVASSLANLAEVYRAMGRYALALPLHQRSLAIREKALGPQHGEVAKSLHDLAETYQAMGQYAQALPLHRRSLAIEEKTLGPEHPDFAISLHNLGGLYRTMGQYEQALSLYERSLAILEKALGPEHVEVANNLNSTGVLYRARGEYAKALPLYLRSLAIREKALGAEHALVATSLNNLAVLYRAMGEYGQALPIQRRSLVIRVQTLGAEHPHVANSLNNLALLYRDMGEYAEALPLYRRSMAIWEKAVGTEHTEFAASLHNLALLYRDMGDYAEALQLHQRTLAIWEKTLGPEHANMAYGLNNLAFVYRNMGEYAQALPLYRRGLAIFERSSGAEHPDVAATLNNLALLYLDLGAYGEALPLYERSLAISEKTLGAEHTTVAISLNNLAMLYREMGEAARALPLVQRSLAIDERALGPEHPAVASGLISRAQLYRAMGQYEQALPLVQRSLAIREKSLGPEHPEVAISLNELAGLYRAMRQYENALPLAQRAERIASAAGARETLWRAQDNLRALHAQAKQPALAIFWGKQSVNTLQGLRAGLVSLARDAQRSYLRDKRPVYTDLADLLLDEGRIAEAQVVMTMLKEEEFFDFLRSDASADPRTVVITPADAERALSEQLSGIRQRLASASAEVARLQRKKKFGTFDALDQDALQAAEPRLAAARSELDAFVKELPQRLAAQHAAAGARTSKSASTHQELLETLGSNGAGVASLQYIVTQHRVRIIATTATTQLVRTVSTSQVDLNRAVTRFREALQDRSVDPRPSGRELYGLVLAPVADALREQGVHTLVLHLDGSLRYVPFAALVDGERYVVERFRLAVATDAARSRLTSERQPHWQVAAWGVTRAFPDQNFAALPGVRDELDGIVRADVLPGSARLDDEFTLPALRASVSTPVLHIASHFRFVTGSEASFLLLGDGTHLTLRQMRKELPRFADVDLLTLSACETAMGSGTNENGLEVEGLGVMAQKHGAKAVLATLWPVADASTAVLMQEFYRNVRQPEKSKAEALRQAQLAALRGEHRAPGASSTERAAARVLRPTQEHAFAVDARAPYAHPYYWAPLILMGNWL